MNQRKEIFGVFLFAETNQITFCVLQAQAGNIANSIGITVGISLILVGFYIRWVKQTNVNKNDFILIFL